MVHETIRKAWFVFNRALSFSPSVFSFHYPEGLGFFDIHGQQQKEVENCLWPTKDGLFWGEYRRPAVVFSIYFALFSSVWRSMAVSKSTSSAENVYIP